MSDQLNAIEQRGRLAAAHLAHMQVQGFGRVSTISLCRGFARGIAQVLTVLAGCKATADLFRDISVETSLTQVDASDDAGAEILRITGGRQQ